MDRYTEAQPEALSLSNLHNTTTTAMAAIDPNDGMDVDMDIDLGLDPSIDDHEAESMHMETEAVFEHQPEPDVSIERIEGEATPEKVHLRGLDNLTTSDIRAFVSEHLPNTNVVKIEWIDDSSANIVFEDADTGARALSVLSADLSSSTSPLQLREAKNLSLQPHVDLQVRIATTADVKKPRAREASRFYLLNPDLDPANSRRNQDGRNRRLSRDRRSQKLPLDEEEETPFDVNMYDDDAAALATRAQRTLKGSNHGRDNSRGMKTYRTGRRRNRELLSDLGRQNVGSGRLRDRSASPTRDGDGRLGFEEGDLRQVAKRRSRTPPSIRRRIANNNNAGKELISTDNSEKELFPPSNMDKELFPTAGKSSILQNSASGTDSVKELFPTTATGQNSNSGVELFTRRKGSTGGHRRKDAFDAGDSTSSSPVRTSTPELRTKSRSLADRITNGPTILDFEEEKTTSAGFSIRGAAQQQENPGYSIRGVAGVNQRVRELFPDKAGNGSGKDLFSRISKPTARTKASDMYT